MSILSQLAAEIVGAAAPLTQAPDDTSSEGDWSTLVPASNGGLDAASAHHTDDDDSHGTSPCSPCLSSSPPPFVAPDMIDQPLPANITVMSWREQQQFREQLMRVPGLYACWRMRGSISSNSAQNQFSEHLLTGHVTRFEIVFAYTGLHRQVSCLYTTHEFGVVFREAPLRLPHVCFCKDGHQVCLVDGADAWSAMHRHFHFKFMPSLLVATVKTYEQAH
jgi:hypothetical protein